MVKMSASHTANQLYEFRLCGTREIFERKISSELYSLRATLQAFGDLRLALALSLSEFLLLLGIPREKKMNDCFAV